MSGLLLTHSLFETHIVLFLVIAGFFASFVDSVVGGGGLISLPALLFTGLPMNMVLGTNKLAGTMSSLTSTLSFLRSGKVDVKLVSFLVPVAFAGAVLGAYTVRLIPVVLLKPLVIVLLIVVTLYTLLKKEWGAVSTYRGPTSRIMIISLLAAFIISFYDGFFGPGTGSFLIFSFLMLGFDFVIAAGNAKVLNFTSNLASLVTFMSLGFVNYHYGLPMGLSMIAGALVGSRLAIRKGVRYIRPLFIIVSILLISKQMWELFH